MSPTSQQVDGHLASVQAISQIDFVLLLLFVGVPAIKLEPICCDTIEEAARPVLHCDCQICKRTSLSIAERHRILDEKFQININLTQPAPYSEQGVIVGNNILAGLGHCKIDTEV